MRPRVAPRTLRRFLFWLTERRPERTALVCLAAAGGLMTGGLPVAVASAAPAWLAPVTFSDPGQSFVEPQVAVDARGDAIMVWNGGGIHAAYRPAGGSWQTPVQISAGIEQGFVGPYENHVAMSRQGDAVAVWSFPYPNNTSEFIVQAAVRPAGGNWQPAETISAPGESSPKVAIDGVGNAISVWTRWDGTHRVVQTASRPAGGDWQVPVDLWDEGRDAYGPRIAFGPRGEAIASWAGYDGSNTVARVSSKPPGGAWEAPIDLSEAGRSASTPRVAFDAHGNAVAVWERLFDCPGCSLNGEVIQSAFKPAGGEWKAPVDISESGKKAEGAQVALDAQGDAVAVWERVGDSGCCVIQTASKPAGSAWQAPVRLSESGLNAGVPTLAVDPAGDAIALWTILDESEKNRVVATVRPAGSQWQAPVDISEAGRNSLEQQVAYDAQGNAVAVWRANSPTYLVVQAAAYDGAGPLLDGFSIPTTGTPSEPLDFSVSPLDVWSAIGPTHWDFGDGVTATGSSASHAYAAPGTYTVTVNGEDAIGNMSSASGTVEISPKPAESPTTETPLTPSQGFRIVHMHIRRDGTMVLKLKSPGSGSFAGCARMVLSRMSQTSGHHADRGAARRGLRRHRHCPVVPRGSRVSFFGEGSAVALGASLVTLRIRPDRQALHMLSGRGKWRIFVMVTFDAASCKS